MTPASEKTGNAAPFLSGISIGNKILILVVTLLLLFTIILALVTGLTISNNLTDITRDELGKISGIFSNSIIELENRATRFVKSLDENRRFMDQARQIAQMGPYYASDLSLLEKKIEDDETIYFLQAQMHLLNFLQPLLPLNEFSAIHYYSVSPFDLVTDAQPVLSFSIAADKVFIMQFKDRIRVADRLLRYIAADKFKPPTQDDIGISSVYAQSADTFYRDLNFNVFRGPATNDFYPAKKESLRLPTSKIEMDGGVPVIRTAYAIRAPMANPETF
jgi:hypothetical protein